MHTGKRLVQYALHHKKLFILALLMLTVAVAAELSGPFIAKRMIDTHILGIEQPWYKVPRETGNAGNTAENGDTVSYGGDVYKRGDRFAEGEARGDEARLLQVGTRFVFVNGPIAFDGQRSWQDGKLTVTRGGESAAYEAKSLTKGELYVFYRPELAKLIQLALLYLGLLAVAAVFTFGERYMLQVSANRVIQKLRLDVYRQIQRLPIHYFDNLPAGKVVSRVTNDTEAVRDLFVTVLANFFTGFVYITGIFIALFLLDVKLGAICLLIVPLLVVWVIVYRKYASRYNKIIRSRLSDINGMINEAIQGMTIIRAFRRQKETMEEFETLNEDYLKHQQKLQSLNALTSHNLVGVLRNISFALLLWHFGGAAMGTGAQSVISFGVLYAFIDYLNRLFQPITGMVNQLATLDQSIISAGRVFELMDEPGEDVTEGRLPRYKGDVSFEQVSFAYKEDYVLKNISFEAKQGQTVALVGHTGSGKSSIMNLLFRFYDPQKGTIRVDGRDITAMPKQLLRQHMGIVLQDPFLFTGTIASNVSLGDGTISREKVDAALRDVGGERIFANLPGGFDEPVLEKGSTLSAGQRQLISFARALAFDPAILILDEATANIDTETEAMIQAALDVVKKGRTTFIIAHRLSTIRSADLILVLHRGEIVERGNHEELLELGGRYSQMYRLQQGGSAAGNAPGGVITGIAAST
ncbi:ABC transporter ATP-binding protein [Paenibacillus chitinolyticus]|uniref:ABC transporter ATP-binding protein n=1 Tax=Paenibacillus chitinolyticus TaxID=79263 RepID=UPI002DB99748|nr:ABC transporter ATP-binding protein [Paenibacillus chitinolyticus]MEC0246064.1 ABC transporter ATP-binding protein [Paenibacillus chitinolyticus]